ncbi:PTS transporter subunit IIC [uncultured Helcococcus sp.]|uniref:PTS transporter subunit IIC n=1 Tax=uncultured Helcococcus sp. TaxID=1072508 RepID=UPI00261A20EF|nr:PTS transporter subunit IIC [uncultured Helcococcus sp.]
MENKIELKGFLMKILNGTAMGIVVGLIPNAILGEIFKALAPQAQIFQTIHTILLASQAATPLLVGIFIGYQFKLQPIETGLVGVATMIGSGLLVSTDGALIATGIGDLINTMITAAMAVYLLSLIRGKLGSLTMILSPVIVVLIVGTLSTLLLPYVKQITTAIGAIIQNFTDLQPLLMSILLSISFALIIVSPISTVAIAYAVGLEGLASGAANLGIASAAMTLVVGAMYVNKIGVPLSVFLGSMKMFMPNWLRYPIMNIPLIANAIVTGVVAYLFNIQGTTASAGFGFSGLVGPINALSFMEGSVAKNILILALVFFVIPFVSAYLIDKVCTKVLKLYDRDIFIYGQEK